MGWLDKWWGMSNPNPSRNYGTSLFFPSLYGQNPQKQQEATSQQFALQKLLGNAGISALNGPLSQNAYSNLARIIASNGKTDPQAMNQTLSGVNRDTSAGQTDVAESAARSGLGGSGLAAALQAAVGQGGASKKADIRAEEAQRAEARKRSDLDLFKSLVVGPSIDQIALALNQYNANRQSQSQDTAAVSSMIGGILKMFGI